MEISHIYKNIYISGIEHACIIDKLIDNNIRAILYLGITNKAKNIIDVYNKHNIKHKYIQIGDAHNSNISKCFEPSWKFINNNIKKGRNVLIHCTKGISRSPTIVAYYLMRKMHERMNCKGNPEPVLDDILTLIKINRSCVKPNRFFIHQLKKYESINITKSTKIKILEK